MSAGATRGGARLGTWLFRYRSYIPPLLLVILGLALVDGREQRTAPGLDPRFLALGLVPTAIGFAIRAFVVGTAPRGTSGRSTVVQVAETLNTSGLYSVVRHPLYLGNFLLWIGLATTTGVWWAPPVIALAFLLFYRPIVATEEGFLARAFGDHYTKWAAVTPRFVPNVRRWDPPALPFALKMVLRQEYYGFFTVVLFLVILELTAAITSSGRLSLGRAWIVVLAVTTIAAGLFRWLQRNTSALDVEGR